MRTNFILSLQQLSEIKTGTCLCLCQGESRSLTANIGAALNMEKEFIEKQLEIFTTNPSIYYIEGFFIPQKMHICRFLYDKYKNNPDTLLVTNLNAPYIVKSFTKDITWLTKKADIVFGNRDEVIFNLCKLILFKFLIILLFIIYSLMSFQI
jgi:adenosine kinase